MEDEERKVLEKNIELGKELKVAINNLRGVKFLSILITVLLIVMLMIQMGWV